MYSNTLDFTHQLNEWKASVAVGNDEDILGCSFGHKVVPNIQHMFLRGAIILKDKVKTKAYFHMFF